MKLAAVKRWCDRGVPTPLSAHLAHEEEKSARRAYARKQTLGRAEAHGGMVVRTMQPASARDRAIHELQSGDNKKCAMALG